MIDKTNWTTGNLMWVAGLLEGEGNFYYDSVDNHHSLVARCKMTDEDVVYRLHGIAGFGFVMTSTWAKEHHGHKAVWEWKSNNSAEVYQLETKILPLMGARRTQQILETHRKRREYEHSTSRSNLKRIFPADCCCLLFNTGCVCI